MKSLNFIYIFIFIFLYSFSFHSSYGINCSGVTTSFIPLNELGTGTYQGYTGGLYPNGSNNRPGSHELAGLSIASSLQALDSTGQANPNGVILMVSIGLSNTSQEFGEFISLTTTYSTLNPKLGFVNAAQGGVPASEAAQDTAAYWSFVTSRLAQFGYTTSQVQIAWLKTTLAQPGSLPDPNFPNDATTLQGYMRTILQIAKRKMPNLKLCYISSRIYAGYADIGLNPEPYAYQSGFSAKWLIEEQINDDTTLNYDSTQGPVLSPWLSWGPYLWANGTIARIDGLMWECPDFQSDGTHPSPTTGRQKVAQLLLDYFSTDSTTVPWFNNPLSINQWGIYGEAILPKK